MRLSRKYAWWAFGVSLLCHVAVGLLICLAFPSVYKPHTAQARAVDCSTTAPPEYPAMTVKLFEAPTPIVVEPPRELPKAVQQAKAIPPEQPAVQQTAASQSTGETSSNPATSASETPPSHAMALPLHGPLMKSGYRVVYVLDRSGSMAGKKLAMAVAMLRASLAQLGPDVRFQIVTYDSRATLTKIAGRLDLAAANTANVLEASRGLDDLCGEGSSRHIEGMRMGLGLQPDLLILLTDAGDISLEDARQINALNRKATPIHAVLIGATKGETASLREVTGPDRIHFIPLSATAGIIR